MSMSEDKKIDVRMLLEVLFCEDDELLLVRASCDRYRGRAFAATVVGPSVCKRDGPSRVDAREQFLANAVAEESSQDTESA